MSGVSTNSQSCSAGGDSVGFWLYLVGESRKLEEFVPGYDRDCSIERGKMSAVLIACESRVVFGWWSLKGLVDIVTASGEDAVHNFYMSSTPRTQIVSIFRLSIRFLLGEDLPRISASPSHM